MRARLLGGVEEGGRADGGKGVMQLWATASTFAPMEKNCLWPPPKVSPLRRRAGKDPGGRLLVCMQPVSRQQLKTSLRQKTDILSNSIIVNGNNSFLHFLELLSVYTHFFFLPHFTLPLSSCYLTSLAAIHKMAAGSWELQGREWKPFSNRSRPRHRERVKISYVKWTINITPRVFSVHVHQRLCLLLLFCLIYCTKKPLGPLGLSNGIKHHTQPLWFNLMQTQIIISLIKRKNIKKIDVDSRKLHATHIRMKLTQHLL